MQPNSSSPRPNTSGHPATPNIRPSRSGRPGGWRLLFLVPVLLFAALALAFHTGLQRDPSAEPSVLIGKPVPTFRLPPVEGRKLGLSTANLRGDVSLVNVFASWCTACREEHPVLMGLHAAGTVAIYGINYKDKPDDAARWLDTMGDPYTRTGADFDGRVAIDWGVYGVPETFVVDRQGHVAFKQIGPITPKDLDRTILPLIAKLRAEPSEPSGAARQSAE